MKNTKTITTYNISVFFFHSSIILGEVISSIKMQKEKVTCRFHMIHRENKCRMNTSCSPQQKSAIHFAPKSLARNHPRKAIGLVMIGGYFAGKKPGGKKNTMENPADVQAWNHPTVGKSQVDPPFNPFNPFLSLICRGTNESPPPCDELLELFPAWGMASSFLAHHTWNPQGWDGPMVRSLGTLGSILHGLRLEAPWSP